MSTVRLAPFEPEHLPGLLPWFDDPETQRRLGGRDWPAREFALRSTVWTDEFRGRRVLRSCTFVALDDDGVVVAQVGGDVYDRWTVWDPATERVLATDPRRTMGAAYVVAPSRRGRGIGAATLRALVAAPETADVEQFVLGIEPDNTASLRAAAAAGFTALTTEPDAEDVVYRHLVR
ncbi:GNAT family N-acetyltransferase [Geodermatophilus sp. SYSU D00766]